VWLAAWNDRTYSEAPQSLGRAAVRRNQAEMAQFGHVLKEVQQVRIMIHNAYLGQGRRISRENPRVSRLRFRKASDKQTCARCLIAFPRKLSHNVAGVGQGFVELNRIEAKPIEGFAQPR